MQYLRLSFGVALCLGGALAIAGCADGGDSRRTFTDAGPGRVDAPATADAPTSACDPPCPAGYACVDEICLAATDLDSDGVPSDVDCDDSSAAVGRIAARPCSSSCAVGEERCTDGVWAVCTAPTSCDCAAGTAPRTVPCMHCGTQRQVCEGGVWRDDGVCMGGGPCSMGEVEMGGMCGNCGTQARTCGIDCTWGAWGCSEEGECAGGATETRTSACGACGEGSRTDTRSCSTTCAWGAWSTGGTCTTSATCAPGATEEQMQACPGGCANQTRTRSCSGTSCTWGAWGAWSSCPSCGPVCGNSSCESGETCSSCASDCRYGHLGAGAGGSSCAGVPAETWRCATTTTCGGLTSQVCRGGVWINYHCAPNNCGTCFCTTQSGCCQAGQPGCSA